MRQIKNVFKGVGGAATNGDGYEGITALEQVSELSKGASAIHAKIRKALKQTPSSARYTLRHLYEECRPHEDKKAAFADGLNRTVEALISGITSWESGIAPCLDIMNGLPAMQDLWKGALKQACLKFGSAEPPKETKFHSKQRQGWSTCIWLIRNHLDQIGGESFALSLSEALANKPLSQTCLRALYHVPLSPDTINALQECRKNMPEIDRTKDAALLEAAAELYKLNTKAPAPRAPSL